MYFYIFIFKVENRSITHTLYEVSGGPRLKPRRGYHGLTWMDWIIGINIIYKNMTYLFLVFLYRLMCLALFLSDLPLIVQQVQGLNMFKATSSSSFFIFILFLFMHFSTIQGLEVICWL